MDNPETHTPVQETGTRPATGEKAPDQDAAPAQAVQQPMGYVMDPATGQVYYTAVQPPQQSAPIYVYGVPPQQVAPQQAAPQAQVQDQVPPNPPDYSQVIKSVEEFAEGDATVADVVKTLYTQTAQDDQFWKGAIVGAAAAVLLTSDTVRGAMGKTLAGLMGGLSGAMAAGAGADADADADAGAPGAEPSADQTDSTQS